jgi:hypothetical protein
MFRQRSTVHSSRQHIAADVHDQRAECLSVELQLPSGARRALRVLSTAADLRAVFQRRGPLLPARLVCATSVQHHG